MPCRDYRDYRDDEHQVVYREDTTHIERLQEDRPRLTTRIDKPKGFFELLKSLFVFSDKH